MFSVALIGADGAGKTTVAGRVLNSPTLPFQYIYMGTNPEAITHCLPTTRILQWMRGATGRTQSKGGPPSVDGKKRSQGLKGALKSFKSLILLPNQLGEEWYRHWVSRRYQKKGQIVLFDRHFFFDYYFHRIAGNSKSKSLKDRLHAFSLSRYPKPDLVILLDAPAEVLHRRKPEGTLEEIESRRREYLGISEYVSHFKVIDATASIDDVVQSVLVAIERFRSDRSSA